MSGNHKSVNPESKDLLDLAQLVSEMRDAQRESDRTGRFTASETARRKAEKVDKSIGSILADQHRPLLD